MTPRPTPGVVVLMGKADSDYVTIPNYEILHIIDNDRTQVAANDDSGQTATPKRKLTPAKRNDLGDEAYGGLEEERQQANSSALNNDELENSEKEGSPMHQGISLDLPPRRWAPSNPPIYVVRTHEGDIVVARSLELDAGSNVARLLDGTTKRIPNDAVGSVHLFRQTGPEAVDVIVLNDGSVNLGELFDSNTRQIMLRGIDVRRDGRGGHRGSPWKAFSRNDILRIVDNATRFHDNFGEDDPSE